MKLKKWLLDVLMLKLETNTHSPSNSFDWKQSFRAWKISFLTQFGELGAEGILILWRIFCLHFAYCTSEKSS